MLYNKNNQKLSKIPETMFLTKNNDATENQKDEEAKKNERQSKNTNFPKINKNNSLQEDKMEIDDKGDDDDNINFKKKLEQTINSKNVSDKDIQKLLKLIYSQIKEILKKSNESNSTSSKSYFEKEINNLTIKAKELEKLKKSFNYGNISSKRSIDSSDDIIKINHKNNYMGNKERQNSGKLIGQQDNMLETTCSISKNHVLINTENNQITKQLEIINQIENNNNFENIFIRVINCSIDNICILINERAYSKYKLDLSYIYIKKIEEINITNYEEFLESTINDIYLGKFLKINHTEKEKIKIWIFSLLNTEKKNEKERLLNILFSRKVKEILLLYINDDPYIQVKNKNNPNFNIKRFNTFRDDFNEYNMNEKLKIKEYIYSLLLLDNITINIKNEENNEQYVRC